MGHTRSRAMLAGLGAAAGAFAAAAMISAATAPTARADDPYADIIADVQAEFAAGQTALGEAATDFSNGDTGDGLTQLFIGLDDDFVGVPDDLEVGTTDALTNATVIPASDFEFNFANPETLTAAVTEAQNFYTEGNNLATTIASLPPTDYADTALDNALSTAYQWILPGQIELIGELESLGF
jgi:hypothetical protein